MMTKETTLRTLRAALEHEPRINLHRNPIRIGFRNGDLVLEGEVDNIAAKKLALNRARTIDGVQGIVDLLRVQPAERRGDGAVRDTVCASLLREPTLRRCTIRARVKGALETRRERGAEPAGEIVVTVENGVVTLAGEAISLSHMRLAEVLAWWAPGCCDVVNELKVVPAEDDNDDEITDALGLVLEKDPLVHADQIRASTRAGIVTLQGLLGTEQERKMAELDAWYIHGVRDVVNRIEVRLHA